MSTRSLAVLLALVHLVGVTAASAEVRPTIRDIEPYTVVGQGQIRILGSDLTRGDGSTTEIWLDDTRRLKDVTIHSASEIEVVIPSASPPTSREIRGSSGHFHRKLEVRVSVPDASQSNVHAQFEHVTWRALLQARSFVPILLYVTVFGVIIWRFKANMLLSETKQWSLSKIQMSLWTVIFSLSYVVLSSIRGDLMDITDGMFWLMGISSTTAVGAKAIVVANIDGLNKDKPSRLLSDYDENYGANDGYRLSLHRCQMALWTVIVAAMFVVGVVTTMHLPDIPNQLLLLMGISGSAYLGFNYPSRTQPRSSP